MACLPSKLLGVACPTGSWQHLMPGRKAPVTNREGGRSFSAWGVRLVSAVAAASCTVRRSHTRPDSVGMARRRRMRERPREQFRRQTGRKPEDKGSFFLLTPSSPGELSYPKHRGEGSAQLRRRIDASKTEQQLRRHLAAAEAQELFDSSVLGASVQKCGYCLWWDMLLEVLDIGERLRIPCDPVFLSSLFKALVCCLQAHYLSAKELLNRKTAAFKIAEPMFDKIPPKTELDSNIRLASALRLLYEIDTPIAHARAARLWQRSEQSPFSQNIVAYAVRLQLLELVGHHHEVDDILQKKLVGKDLSPNIVVLGGLLNTCAKCKDWKRADRLWKYLVEKRGVKAKVPQYSAYAKAHLLCGRPADTVRIICGMVAQGIGPLDYKVAVEFLQAQVLVCHCSPSTANKSALSVALKEYAHLVKDAVPKSARLAWQRLSNVATALLSDSSQSRLADVLVTSQAKEAGKTGSFQSDSLRHGN